MKNKREGKKMVRMTTAWDNSKEDPPHLRKATTTVTQKEREQNKLIITQC